MVSGNKTSLLMTLMVMMAAMVAGVGPAMGQEDTSEGVSDLTVDMSDGESDYGAEFEVYNASDDTVVVDSLNDGTVNDDGTITFTDVAHGDYYISTAEASTSATSDNFTHDGEETVSWDVTGTSVEVSGATYVLTADATLDGEVVEADFTVGEDTKTGEEVTFDVEDGEYDISAEYVEEVENEDGEMEEVTYTASDTVDMDSSDQSVTLELTEDSGVLDPVKETGESLIDDYGLIAGGLIVLFILFIGISIVKIGSREFRP